MNKARSPAFQAANRDIEDADFEIVSSTAAKSSSFRRTAPRNSMGFAIIFLVLVVFAFLASGGWHLFRN